MTTMSVGDTLSKRPDAIIEKGDAALNRGLDLLETWGIPRGILMPLQSHVEEGGGIEETRDIWLKQKNPVKHFFKRANSYVSYGPEISCKLEKNKMKEIKGVKAKRKYMPIMLPIKEIVVDDDDEEEGGDNNESKRTRVKKIHFKAYANLEEAFPAELFNTLS